MQRSLSGDGVTQNASTQAERTDGGVIVGLLVALLAPWAALIVVLWLVGPRNVRLAELVRVVPDLVRIVRGLLRGSFWAAGRGRCRVSSDPSRIGVSLDFAS